MTNSIGVMLGWFVEFCRNGLLSDELERMLAEGKSMPIVERLSWYKQVMSAMAYIHSKVHSP